MKVSIYSLEKVLFEGDALSVNAKTTSGEITILDHHRPLISELAPGTLTIVDSAKKEHFVPVTSGFLEVSSGNRAKLIVDEA
jgi:F-type H+-transporting ATPase subunit epsilon